MKILWETPEPSSGWQDVTLKILPQRNCALSFPLEKEEGGFENAEVRFTEVVALKCTYLPSLTLEMIESAYDKLVDMGDTQWLREARGAAERWPFADQLKHLRICFDDGPCYEFICSGFEAPGLETHAAPNENM